MITADQIFAHIAGDYILQSHWMATEKTKRSLAAAVHVVFYAIPFVVAFKPSLLALIVIAGTHFVIDRWRLARFVVYVKNLLAPFRVVKVESRETAKDVVDAAEAGFAMTWFSSYVVVSGNYSWRFCAATGYHKDVPAWLSVWLLIIVDNAMHIGINALALRYL